MAMTRKIYNGLYIVGNDHNNAPINNTKSTQTTFLVLPFVIFTSLFTTKKKNKIKYLPHRLQR